MFPRITMNMTSEGELEIWLNDKGRNLLVRELQALNEKNDHFHLGAFEGAEVKMNSRVYKPTDTLIDLGKVLFRTDDWDRSYFHHVMEDYPT